MALSTKAKLLLLHAVGDPAIRDEIVAAVDAAGEISTSEIAADAVTFAKLQNSASAGRSVIGKTATGAGDFAEIATTTSGHVLRYDGTNVAFGTLGATSLAAGAVDLSTSTVTGILADARMPNLTGDVTTTEGAVATTIANNAVTADKILADAVTTAKILDANVTKAKLAATCRPSHMIVAAGTHTTAGGDANETITATGALGTDTCQVSVKTKGGTPRTLVAAAAGTDDITVEMSGDPGSDHVLQWCVIRATS